LVRAPVRSNWRL